MEQKEENKTETEECACSWMLVTLFEHFKSVSAWSMLLALSAIRAVTFWGVTWRQNNYRKPQRLLPPIHLVEVKVFQMFQLFPYVKAHPALGSGWRVVQERSQGQRCSLVLQRWFREGTHTAWRVCVCVCVYSSFCVVDDLLLVCEPGWFKANTHTHRRRTF